MEHLLMIFGGMLLGFYFREVSRKGDKLTYKMVDKIKEEVENITAPTEVEVEEIYFTLEKDYDLVLYAPIHKDRLTGDRYYLYDPRLPGFEGMEKIPYHGRYQFREKIVNLFRYDYKQNRGAIISNELESERLKLISFRFTILNRAQKTRYEYEYHPPKRGGGFESFHNKGMPTEEKGATREQIAQFDPEFYFEDASSPANECGYNIQWIRGTKSALTRYPRLLSYYLAKNGKRLKCLGVVTKELGD